MASEVPCALASRSFCWMNSSDSSSCEAASKAAVIAGLAINNLLHGNPNLRPNGCQRNDSPVCRLNPPSNRMRRWLMAARPTWHGVIKLALVSIPVEIFSATNAFKSIAFHQVHEPSGQRVRYEKVVHGIGPVDRDEILKGYEVSKGEYVLIDPEEIEKVKLESRKTLELTQFVELTDIDPIYFDKPYYVAPADDLAEEAFVVLRDALKKTKRVGIGQLAMRGQEYVVSLKPCGRGMVLETLRYADEVNKAASYFRDIGDAKPDPDPVSYTHL